MERKRRLPRKSFTWCRFGELVILWEAFYRWDDRYVHCKCDCGKEKDIYLRSLTRWATHSCWCREKERQTRFGKMRTTHWLANKPINNVYFTMRARCNNPKNIVYNLYWGRWIQCMRKTFSDFYADMWESYREHCKTYWPRQTTIDRIDSNWNYCKQNCRWATCKEQSLNKRPRVFKTNI